MTNGNGIWNAEGCCRFGWRLAFAREDSAVNRKPSPWQQAIQLNFLTLTEVITLVFISIFIIFTVYNSSGDLWVRRFLAANNRLI